ncbi:MAG: hypothetical protein E7323_13415 [Clostridiales bacterium]|nr:hypothetical protein [Clostridiales bacterium]
MKKLFAFLLACMMLLPTVAAFAEDGEDTDNTVVSTSVYTPVKPSNELTVTHTMTLTEEGASELPYNITYTFGVTDTADVMLPTGLVDKELAVTGKPVIGNVVFGPADTFTDGIKTKTLEIDWSGVSIKEPGVYRWKVTKGVVNTSTTDEPTNKKEETYLYVYATDNAGTLVISGVYLTTDAANSEASQKGNFGDEYPAKTIDLTISKNVSGNYASKDQYFMFSLSLTAPSGAAEKTYTIEGVQQNVPATAYHQAKTNVTSIKLEGGKTETVTLWMKHGQMAKISDLLFGTGYSVTEAQEESAGYEVTATVTGDEATNSGATVTDNSLEKSTTVAYTNTKEATVPTGIDLQTGAPIMGLLMAASMLLMLFIGKRKEAAE